MLPAFPTAILFGSALALGSFLNVVAARVPDRRSVVRPRSACPSCGTEIGWRDNIPVLSYFLLRGRCRHCDVKISPLYPAVELGTAALVTTCFLVFGLTAYALLAAFFCAVLVVLTSIDIQRQIVPNRIVRPAIVIVLVAHTVIDPSAEWLVAALGAALFFFLAALAYPKGLGMGDVRFAGLLGAMLGVAVTVAIMIGLVAALVPSIALFARHGMQARKMKFPFVPFLALGGVIALFAGNALLGGYTGLFE